MKVDLLIEGPLALTECAVLNVVGMNMDGAKGDVVMITRWRNVEVELQVAGELAVAVRLLGVRRKGRRILPARLGPILTEEMESA